jgi:phage gp29-like protein
VIGYAPTLDNYRRYLTDSPTPARFATLLKQIDEGDYAAAVELHDEMMGKDGRLQAVVSRRREALTALDWSCEPNPHAKDKDFAKAVAEYCEDELRKIHTWPGTLKHYATAIGPGIAASENVWHRGRLIKTVDVGGHRLTDDYTGQSPDIFIETEHNQMPGIRAVSPKFVVHMPQQRAGYRLRVTLGRATVRLWIIKHFGLADWTAFSEKFGTPIPHAEYPPGTTGDERTELQAFLRDYTADSYFITREGVKINLLTVPGTGTPYPELVKYVNDEYAILYLGQTLTTEQQSVGALSLGKVHADQKASITLSDIAEEAETIERGVLRPMCLFRYPARPDVPVPQWTRKIIEEKNLAADTLDLQRVQYARAQNLALDDDVTYDRLGLPQPTEDKQ